MRSIRAVAAFAVLALGAACGGSSGGGEPPTPHTVTVGKAGAGTGTITSTPAGISCGDTCAADFSGDVTLAVAADEGSKFVGWHGACSGLRTSCTVSVDAAKSVTASFSAGGSGLPAPNAGGVAAPSGDVGGLTVLDWAGFGAAVSYSFDDGLASQVYGDNYALLHATGIPVTYYVTPGQVEPNLTSWQQILADGNELGNHTYNHCQVDADGVLSGCAYGTPANDATPESEIADATDYIVGTIGQPSVWTMASPFGNANWDAYAPDAGMLIQRDLYGGTLPPNDLTDQFHTPSYFFGTEYGGLGDTAAVINTTTDSVASSGGWGIYLFHKLAPFATGDGIGCCLVPVANVVASLDYVADRGDIWADSVVNVGAYWVGQYILNHADSETVGDATTWTWELPANFPPGKYVRVTVTGGVLSQGGEPLVWDEHGYYEVALDAGELTLTDPSAPGASALKITADTASNAYGDWGVVVTFPIEAPGVDLSTGDWTATADYYIPGAYGYPIFKSFAYQFSNGGTPDWSQAAAETYSGYSTDSWQTLSYPLSSGFGALTAAKQFRIRFSTSFSNPPDPADGTPVVFYLRNIKLSNGTTTALDIPVTTATATDVGTISLGTGAITIETP